MRANRIAIERGRFHASSGTNQKFVYDPKVMEDGTIRLSPSGTINTDEHIEAQRASTELSVIISKFLSGDSSVLNRYAPVYADLTDGPKNLAEAMQSLINAERAFDALSVDIKRQFGSDWRVWLAQAGSETWLNAMGINLPEAVTDAAALPDQAIVSSEPPKPKRRKAPDVQPLSDAQLAPVDSSPPPAD